MQERAQHSNVQRIFSMNEHSSETAQSSTLTHLGFLSWGGDVAPLPLGHCIRYDSKVISSHENIPSLVDSAQLLISDQGYLSCNMHLDAWQL